MGSVFVFIEQFVQEMLVAFSAGSSATYRRLVTWHYIVFCVFQCPCSLISTMLYERVSFAAPFYVSAGLATVAATVYLPYFACRRGRESGAITGAPAAVEPAKGNMERSLERPHNEMFMHTAPLRMPPGSIYAESPL